jgi:hypothetical protein
MGRPPIAGHPVFVAMQAGSCSQADVVAARRGMFLECYTGVRGSACFRVAPVSVSETMANSEMCIARFWVPGVAPAVPRTRS